MKILFISGGDQQYGSFQMAVKLLEGTRKINKNVRFILITQTYGMLNDWCLAYNIENYVVPYKYCVYYPEKNKLKTLLKYMLKYISVTINNYIAVKKLEKLGIMNDIDIIHTNVNRDLLGNMLSKKYNIPNITYLREFSRAHFHLRLLYKNQIAFMNKYTARFVAVSRAVKNDWIEYGLAPSKVTVIYDGIDITKYKVNQMTKNNNELRLVMCASIYEGKGQLEIVMAINPLIKAGYNIFLDFYGASTNKKYYKRLLHYIDENRLAERIAFKGYTKELPKYLNRYNVGVVCSKAEGFGVVTVEYLASGLTVVASNTGANPELLNNGEFGYLYPLGNVKELSRIISDIYNTNFKQDYIKKKMAVEYVDRNFSIETTVNGILSLYSTVLKEKQ